jgi:hypothetical protein
LSEIIGQIEIILYDKDGVASETGAGGHITVRLDWGLRQGCPSAECCSPS